MLNGIRIIEIEGLGPGPFAAMTLADLGAEVIVIHRKGGSSLTGDAEGALLDRGKRSIALDLKNADDLQTAKDLIASADGLIEGFRPGVMEKLGLGPDVCHAINPKLVFGRMTGWGQSGPLSQAAGHDMNYISMSGAMWYSSAPGDVPMPPATLVGDIGGGAMYLVAGILAALISAGRTGEGTVVDAAIYDGSAHMMNLLIGLRQIGQLSDTRGRSLLDGPHWSHTYACADGGFMSVQCLEPQFYALFLQILELTEDPEFKQQMNKKLWPALTKRLADLFAQHPRAHWEAMFVGTDACVAPVLTPTESAAHEMNQARQVWRDVAGTLQAAAAPRFSTHDWQPKPSPARGQDSDEILKEIKASLSG